MSRHYDEDGRCRHCRRYDGEHKASCVLAPDDPLPDDPAFDPTRCAHAEDDYQAMIMDGHR